MNDKEIGGYIELELPKIDGGGYRSIVNSKIAINSARNGIRYIIKAYNIKKLYVPYYTCPVVWEAIEQENVELLFYCISDRLIPDCEFESDSYILYTNYFGVCAEQIKQLSKKYKNLIVDNAQGFYMPPYGIGSAYSPRKFFGVSDGGYVYCQKKLNEEFKKDVSYDRFSHLLKRIDGGSNFGYEDFWKNDNSLIGADIMQMSNLTERILQSIDYDEVKKIRLDNFHFLHEHLKTKNKFNIEITEDDVPMYYPFLCENDTLRDKFLDNNIYIPGCWRGMEERCSSDSYELYLKKYMFPLIIDQRYDKNDMKRMLDIINSELEK